LLRSGSLQLSLARGWPSSTSKNRPFGTYGTSTTPSRWRWVRSRRRRRGDAAFPRTIADASFVHCPRDIEQQRRRRGVPRYSFSRLHVCARKSPIFGTGPTSVLRGLPDEHIGPYPLVHRPELPCWDCYGVSGVLVVVTVVAGTIVSSIADISPPPQRVEIAGTAEVGVPGHVHLGNTGPSNPWRG